MTDRPHGSRCGRPDTENLQVLANEAPVLRRVGQQVEFALVVQGQILGHFAQLSPRKYRIQIFIRAKGAMRIVCVARDLREARVVVGDKGRHEGVGGLNAGDPLQSELLDQTVLERLVCPFDAPFCRRRVGADPIDVQLIKRAGELGVPRTTDCLGSVDPKDARLVAVKGQRLAKVLEILASGIEIRERRLSACEAHDHEPAGGIIDIDNRGAHRGSILEPAMLTTIDLNELTDTGTPGSRLLDFRRPVLARDP